MKPLLRTVLAICLLVASRALPENIEDVKSLPQTKDPIVEAESSEPQARAERCTTCSGNLKLGFKSPNEVLAAIQALPGSEVHTQSTYEGCSSDKGCAGIKVKDGKVIEKYGNADSFRAAAAAEGGDEFSFHAAGTFGNNVFDWSIPKDGPFWWMNENSPFKNVGAGGGSYEKFSKSSSSSFTSGGNAGTGGGASFTGSLDLSGNPFLNGDFAKLGQGFAAGGSSSNGFAGQEAVGFNKPTTGGASYQSSSFESSSFSNKAGDVDLKQNPFLNGGFSNKFGQSGFQGQVQGGQAATNKFSGSAQGGYVGSSPSPFTAYNGGSNVNLIQNGQKTEYDFEQNIDQAFKGTGNVHGHEHAGGELQQTCAGQGYVCVHKAQCNNGVVNTNGGGVLQAATKKQYCNTKTEICCRIEIATVPGAAGVGLQGSLGVGSATYSGSGSTQGSGLFATNSGSSSSGSNSFGASGSGSNGFSGARGSNTFGAGSSGTNAFGSNASGSNAFGASGSNSFGLASRGSTGFASSASGSNNFGAGVSGSNTFGSGGSRTNTFGAGASGSNAFGSGVSNSNGFGSTQGQGSFGSTTNGLNTNTNTVRGSGSYGSGNQGATGFGVTAGFGAGNGASNTFGSSSSSFESKSSFGNTGFTGSTASPGLIHIPPATNDVFVHGNKKTQTNFVETDSFSAGSEAGSIYRPGAGGAGLKPGIPYLPPAASNTVSSTVLPPTPAYIPSPTTPRPVYTPRPSFSTARPTYLPPSTAAPGYLPPVVEQTMIKETRVPKPTYTDGSLYLDINRPGPVPAPNEVPSGCAAALLCTLIEYCTAEGVISNTTVILTKDQEDYRVPLTDCRHLESGRVGKCCRDPLYTDPWPANQLGKWVPGVFGGNDGKYSPDSRGSHNNPRPQVTARPPSTGSTILNNFLTAKPTPTPFPYPGVTVSQGAYGQKGQFEVRGQGQYQQGGIGQVGQGQIGQRGQGAFVQQQGQGQISQKGQGQFVQQGQGQYVQTGQGQYSQGGVGQFGVVGQGQVEIQEEGSQGQVTQFSGQRGVGQSVIQGQGQLVNQGFGQGVRQGQGLALSQGGGFGVENEYSESSLQRVFLQQFNAGGQCGLFNGQKPYGNRNELEVDFAEIPWQAMVLLQTNRSLLCGGVITRPDVVITSAACVDGLEAKNVLIKGGEWKLGIDEEPLPFQIVQVKNILRHPGYKRGSLHNDVAILVLTENLRWSKNIYPICLPGADETLDAFYNGAGECIVTGWGKQVLQAHLAGSIMHSLNVSLINPGECQAKLSQDYPHLIEQYDQNSCACGQPTNPINNICKVDIGSALACTMGDGHYTLRGIYSWDSGCQPGNQLAAFFKFDLVWYEWALGLSEGGGRFAQYTSGVHTNQNTNSGQNSASFSGGVKGGQFVSGGVKGGQFVSGGVKGGQFVSGGVKGGSQFGGQYSQFSKFSESQGSSEAAGLNFGAQIKPIQNTFSATYSEKKVYQSEPKYVTFTTKPEIVTFTTKPEIFTYTTKPKLVTYTTKPQIITYETSGSGQNPQYVAPGVTYNPSFSQLVSPHQHNAECKCNGKK